MRATVATLVCCTSFAVSAPAAAQQTPAGSSQSDLGGTSGSQTFSVRGHVSVFVAGGLDLDVIGNVTNSGRGTLRGTQMLIDPTAYPDVYVRTQRRRYVGVGFGVMKSVELIARYQDASNPAATVLIGRFGSNTNLFPVSFDNYKDRLIEFGLRKYTAAAKRSRVYVTLAGGVNTVQPLRMTMLAPGGNVQAELYSTSRIPSYSIEFGVTLEYHRVGVFVESGFRYQKRLTRNDNDLGVYGLDTVNDTGSRFFMPANVGLILRF